MKLSEEDIAFIRRAGSISACASRHNILTVGIIFIHEDHDTAKKVVDHILLAPPIYEINPNFIKDVFSHLHGLSHKPFIPVNPNDYFAHQFFELASNNSRFSYFWMTYAQFSPFLDIAYKTCHVISSVKHRTARISIATRHQSSACLLIDEKMLFEYSIVFVERWKLHATLVLVNPNISKPVFKAISK